MADIVIDRSDAQIKTGIEKASDLQSSASEIDGIIENGLELISNENKISVNSLSSFWEVGGLQSTGVENADTTKRRSNFIDVSTWTDEELYLDNFVTMYRINQYDASFVHIAQVSTETTSYIRQNSAHYIRVVTKDTLGDEHSVYSKKVTTTEKQNLNYSSAATYGFHPLATATANSNALNMALFGGGKTVIVDIAGIYDIDSTVYIDSDTKLILGKGVRLRRQSNNGYVFLNRGALTKTYNENIEIENLDVITNGFESTTGTISGLRGHVCFFYVKNLEINGYNCEDVGSFSFFIQVCTFDNIKITKGYVEGDKDAVHLGRGKTFLIKDSKFKTFDDPIALNAHDYATSNPELGDITDGVIENCYDLNDDSTSGYFCRLLVGAWIDWEVGMSIQNGDTVVNGGRMYRALNTADGTIYTSNTAPTHTIGTVTIDGINWHMSQEEEVYSANIDNIRFNNIYLEKPRSIAISMHMDKDVYSRSYYPNAVVPTVGTVTFDNVVPKADFTNLIRAIAPVKTIKYINSKMGDFNMTLSGQVDAGLVYPNTNVLFSNTTFEGSGSQSLLGCNAARTADIKILGSIVKDGTYTPTYSAPVTVISSDI